MRIKYILFIAAMLAFGMLTPLEAQVPGPADAGRVRQEDRVTLPPRATNAEAQPALPPIEIPPAAKNTRFVLSGVKIVGMTVFSQAHIAQIYENQIGNTVGLDLAYLIAGHITQRYREQGYFLSRADVRDQSLRGGVITIHVTEGYVASVALQGDASGTGLSHSVIQSYVQRILAQKPLQIKKLESALLGLNDLPGLSFRSIISAIDNQPAPEGAVQLTLIASPKQAQGVLSFDNFGSKFLGPHEGQVSLSASILPMQQTTVSALLSLPWDELQFGTINHSFVIAPDLSLQFNAGIAQAFPGSTLAALEIDSLSTSFGVRFNYQFIRQRDQNLNLFVSLESRDTESNSLGTLLTQDNVRILRAGFIYDLVDEAGGYNSASMTLSQGINAFGSSQAGDLDLSRAEATPDFTKFEFLLTRLQPIDETWSFFAGVSGQWASGPLFSSEEFGYGGQMFGRAFDASDITGDHGLSASFEVRYGAWSLLEPFGFTPYAFYDIGVVWNDDIGQPSRQSGASAGLGVRAETKDGLSANIGLAWPLGRDVTTPIYGGSDLPRLIFQVSQQF